MDRKKALETFMTGENFTSSIIWERIGKKKLVSLAILSEFGHPMLRQFTW